MAVYLHSSGLICAKNCEKRTALQLGQSLDLPYFNAFDKPLLNLAELVELLALQIEQTMAKAGWQIAELAEIPILLGSTAYTISDCEWRFTNGQSLPTTPNITAIAERLKQRFGSPVWSFATSCTSSAQAIGYAAKMIEQGKCRKAIVLGFEMFNRLTFEHFQAMGLLAQSADEKGIILGEGIGCVLLSDEPSDCQISALASLTDNGSLTNSNPDLLKDLIKQILQKSSLDFSEIDAIKPHFVGGIFDETEQAVLQTFGNIPPLVLPKKRFGHTLGASGAMEMAWLLEQLKSENKPQTILNYFLGFGGSHIGWILKWK
ncbi:beta-ketoacyl synthase N-terminal-like domain-containing protein [Actinobacillus porcinus]|uniref:beta-ketoacyl synthase N-terminal-like domain-containing protein n=1 Tax=Actinobacillus porcinus TaxID=51048 RepID=UPI002A910752|nr:beta-ketoacyl synthase N-terminal-like domain-containing protein [Actinobacillus porcinus]MDY6216252.1 beta-ketoacyl synthase N-terminal-like domain-containing protein [Actinobacillus porcinus]